MILHSGVKVFFINSDCLNTSKSFSFDYTKKFFGIKEFSSKLNLACKNDILGFSSKHVKLYNMILSNNGANIEKMITQFIKDVSVLYKEEKTFLLKNENVNKI